MEYEKRERVPLARVLILAKQLNTISTYAVGLFFSIDGCKNFSVHITNEDLTNTMLYKVEQSFDGENWVPSVAETTLAASSTAEHLINGNAVKARVMVKNGTGSVSTKIFSKVNPYGTI